MKWIGVIILAVVGILAAIVAVEYLTTPIHSLPSIIGGHHTRGHYHKRGYAALLVAVVALGGAVYLTLRIRRTETGAPAVATADTPAPASSADGLLATSAPTPDPAPETPTDS
jgi:hypothetical protein